MSPNLKGTLIALAGTLAWSFTGILISLLLKRHAIAPLTLAFWRDGMIGVAVWLALRLARPQALRITRRDVGFFLVYGGLGLAIFNALWTFSVRFNGAAVATVLAYSSPAFTVLLGRLTLKEPLTARKWLAVALSLGGCVLVAGAYRPEVWRVNALGLVLGLGAALAFAAYSLVGRWSARRYANSWTVMAYGFLFAAAALALTQTPAAAFSLGTDWEGWAWLICLALGPSLLGFGLYLLSLRYLTAGVASLIASLEPMLTAVIAIPVLGEMLDGRQWGGAALILLAVAVVQGEGLLARGRKPPAEAAPI